MVRPLGGAECAAATPETAAQRLGVLQVRLSEPLLSRQLSARVPTRSMGATVVFGVLLALATALSLHFFLGRPLRRLTAIMRRAEEGDLLVRAETRGTDEISRLGAAFNQMLARLTSMKAEEIDTHRDLALAKEKLALEGEAGGAHHGAVAALRRGALAQLHAGAERAAGAHHPAGGGAAEDPQLLDHAAQRGRACWRSGARWPQHRGSEGLTFAHRRGRVWPRRGDAAGGVPAGRGGPLQHLRQAQPGGRHGSRLAAGGAHGAHGHAAGGDELPAPGGGGLLAGGAGAADGGGGSGGHGGEERAAARGDGAAHA